MELSGKKKAPISIDERVFEQAEGFFKAAAGRQGDIVYPRTQWLN